MDEETGLNWLPNHVNYSPKIHDEYTLQISNTRTGSGGLRIRKRILHTCGIRNPTLTHSVFERWGV